jgi:uncharacterized protein YaaN involved in tellurite resistance
MSTPRRRLRTCLPAAPAPQAEAIRTRMAELDMGNTQSIIRFGSAAQAELQVISQDMLADVKNKDVGPAGDSLREIVTTIRGFSVASWTCAASKAGGKS